MDLVFWILFLLICCAISFYIGYNLHREKEMPKELRKEVEYLVSLYITGNDSSPVEDTYEKHVLRFSRNDVVSMLVSSLERISSK